MACYGRNRIQRGRAPEIRASQSSIEPSLVKINQHAVNLPTKLNDNLCYQMIETSLCNVSVSQSNSVIEYLDRFSDAAPMIPNDRDAALDARMLAYILDSYVSVPVQQIVGEALRPKDQQVQGRVTEAKERLDKSYAWLASRIGDSWA